jgi:multiple sugar transport system substrate-binding protein
MKKMFLILLVLMFCLASTGCAKKTGEILFWTFHANEEGAWMQSLVDEYARVNPGVKIKLEFIPQAEYMNGTALTSAFAANSGPDIYVMSPGDFLKYVNSGLALDLTPYYTQAMLDDFMATSIQAVTVNGKIYAVPFEIELLGLYYDKDVLDGAGVAVPKTWDELIDATGKLTTPTRPGLAIPTEQGYYQNFVWYPFLWANNAEVLDVNAKKGVFEGPRVEQSLKIWGDLVKAGAAAKLPRAPTDALIGDATVPMQVVGTWLIGTLEREYADKNIQLAPIPIPAGGRAATDAGGWKFMVNAKTKYRDEAAKFVMWALAENIEKPLEWCTKVKFAYSPRKSVVAAGQSIYSQGLRKVFTEDIYASAIPEPRYPAEIVNAVGEALQAVMFGNADPAAAAARANEKINAYIGTYQGSL